MDTKECPITPEFKAHQDFLSKIYYSDIADLTEVLNSVHQSLEDRFYEDPPNAKQQQFLDTLKKLQLGLSNFF